MNYGKKIALFRPPSRSIESESVLSFDDIDDDDKDSVKRKTRNLSEKKRRDQFNVLINELCSMVAANTKKMDKSTVLKSAIQFLRNHQEFSVQSAANEIKEDWKPTFLCSEEFAQLMLEAVESFLVVFTQQGQVLFVSDSVTSLLGHLPSDLINHSLYDIIHEDDRLKFFNLLSKFQPHGVYDDGSVSFTGHLRRGSVDPNEPATYEYVKVFGTTQMVESDEQDCDHNDFIGVDAPKQSLCFCCTVRLQTSHIIREMSIVDETTTCEFTSRHSLEWKFLFLDHRAPPIIGYLPFEVLGTSGYDYYHPDDLEIVSKCHEQLILMGKGRSNCYRFLTKGQQWIWLQTRYFVTYHQWNSKPEFIVCTNTVVGYGHVRRQLRQDMGYVEGDAVNTAVNSTTNSGSVGSECLADAAASKEGRPQQEGHVTSLSQSENLSTMGGKIVQSPDVASSQHSDSERTQQPHSTKPENNTRRHVSSQLQSLLQLHLQRSLAASSAASSLQAAHTTSTATTAASSDHLRLTLTSAASQARVACSSHSTLISVGQPLTRGQARVLPSLVPLMTAMSTSFGSVSTNQRLLSSGNSNMNCHSTAIISSPLTSPAICADPHSTSGLVISPAQQLLHEQLVHKSEQLQSAIQRQQEELRFIKEQLAYTHGGSQIVSQQQHAQQSRAQQQQSQIHQQQQSQIHQQQQQQQQQQQHQYVLQQRLGLGSQSMLFTPISTSAQFAMMGSNPNHIFLSPITEVMMDPQARQQQHHQQQQQRQTHMQCQQQQIVLQHDTGRPAQTMMLTPTSPGSQLTLIRSSPNQIFLSPTSMDLLPSPQQAQQQHQHQEQSLHFLGVPHTSPESNSNME